MQHLFKFKSADQNIGFIGDFHYGHDRDFIVQARGFETVQQHDQFLIDNINQHFDKNDILISVGDNTCGCSSDHAKKLLWGIQPKVFTIWGNHPNPFRQFYQTDMRMMQKEDNTLLYLEHNCEIYPWRLGNFIFVGEEMNLVIDKHHIVCNHMPQNLWNKSHHGSWCLCGHSHGSFPETNLSNTQGKIFDVGVDTALQYSNRKQCFFYWQDIVDIMAKRTQITAVDHHE